MSSAPSVHHVCSYEGHTFVTFLEVFLEVMIVLLSLRTNMTDGFLHAMESERAEKQFCPDLLTILQALCSKYLCCIQNDRQEQIWQMKLTTKNLCQSRRIIALESPGSRWNYPRWKEREELGNWRLLSSPWPLPGSVVKPAAGCCAHHPQLVKVQEQVAAVSQTCTSNPLLDLRLTTEGSEDQN